MIRSLMILQAEGVGKSFSGVAVLSNVSFDIRAGEVHTLMGENGAGKSTLMKIIAGVYQPDAGQMKYQDKPIHLASPSAAIKAGIALIHQEPLNFPDLSVAENIFLGRGLPKGIFGQIDWAAMNARAAQLLQSLGVNMDPRTRMSGLSIADQQMVELAAALSLDAKVLLMDEPTAALTPSEVAELFRIVRGLKAKGVAIVFISHRLPEVFEISDRITVLRDGNCIGTKTVSQTSPDEIIKMMVGRELGAMYDKPTAKIGNTLLKVQGLTLPGQFENISFEVRAGEIVGLAGLVGAGRTEVAQAIFGITHAESGTISIDGKPVAIGSPKDALAHGLAYVPEDRQKHGLLGPMSIASNTSLARLSSVSSLGFLLGRRERNLAEEWKGKLRTRLRDVSQPISELSGGNQQKVVLAKWLNTDPRILIVDEPTRGIDVGAKAEVHHLLCELAQQGRAIVMISSDLPEVLAMSDRVLVMREGRLTAELSRTDATQQSVMTAAAGTVKLNQSDTTAQKQSPKSFLSVLKDFRELPILVFVLLTFLIVGLKEPRYWSSDNLRTIALYCPIFAILAVGQLMVIISRNIDLSVGAILGMSAMVVGGIFAHNLNFPLPLAALIAAGVGLVLGLVNGGLVAYLRVPAIIATLGTFTAYRGLIYIYCKGKQIDPNDLPPSLIDWSQTGPLGVPLIIYMAITVAILIALFLRYTTLGREIYAVGSNPRAAVLRGIGAKRVVLTVFGLTGLLSGFAGLLFGSRFPTINAASVGVTFELVAISAVVIGGAAVNGGAGSVLGTILGVVLLALVNVALTILKVSESWQLAFYGAAILLAATLDSVLRRSSVRRG